MEIKIKITGNSDGHVLEFTEEWDGICSGYLETLCERLLGFYGLNEYSIKYDTQDGTEP